MHPEISVIAPMYNEEAVIEVFIEETYAVLAQLPYPFELILVDDGSQDGTLARCLTQTTQRDNLRILAFSRNYGHEIASTAGLEHAKGQYAILMDADLQHPPQLIPQLIAKAKEGYDIVTAARQNPPRRGFLKRLLSRWFYRLARKMTGFAISEEAGNYRLLSRQVITSFCQMRESNRHLLMLFAYLGFKSASIPYICPERFAGESKYGYRQLINLAIDSIISFSHRPLRYMSIISVLISLVMTAYAGFIVLQRLFLYPRLPEGIASVIFITSGLFAILFLFLAIISEYIARILVESKNRPLYYIAHEYVSQNLLTK